MKREKGATGLRPRTWTVLLGIGWALLGALSLSAGETWLGVGLLVLAGMHVLAAVSARFGAFADAPLFRRNRTHDAR